MTSGLDKATKSGKPSIVLSPWLRAILVHHNPEPPLPYGSSRITSAAFSPCGSRVLTVRWSNGYGSTLQSEAHIWDTASAVELLQLAIQKASDPYAAAVYSPDGARIATFSSNEGSPGPGVWIWNSANGRPLLTFSVPFVNTVAFSADGSNLLVSRNSTDGEALVFDLQSGLPILTLHGAWNTAYSPDSSKIAAAGGGGVRVFDALSGYEWYLLPKEPSTHQFGNPVFVFSPSGTRIFTSSVPGSTFGSIWNAYTGDRLCTLPADATDMGWFSRVMRAAFLPGEAQLVTIDYYYQVKSSVRVWNTNTGAKLVEWPRHVRQSAFSPVSTLIATVDADDETTVHVWDLSTGLELQTLSGHTSFITSLVFSPDGSQLLTGSLDGTACLWFISPSFSPAYYSRYSKSKGPWSEAAPFTAFGATPFNNPQAISPAAPQIGDVDNPFSAVPGLAAPAATLTAPAIPLAAAAAIGPPRDFATALAAVGVSADQILAFAASSEISDLGEVLEYLRVAVIDGEYQSSRVLAHIELLGHIPPGEFGPAKKFVQQLRHLTRLAPEVAEWAEGQNVAEALDSLILQHLALQRLRDPVPREHSVAYLRSLLRFFEWWQTLVTDDPNVRLIWEVVSRFGSIQEYYACHEIPQAAVKRMLEVGYNTDYLVHATGEVLALGPAAITDSEAWPDNLLKLVRSVIGTRESEPELDVGIDRLQIFHQIRGDLDAVKKNRDVQAAVHIIDRLVPEIERSQERYLRVGNVAVETELKQCSLEMLALRRLLSAREESIRAERLVARRSPKLIPEIFFDNTRLSCCLFKPNGLFHGEICRLTLDPATPVLEFWLEPRPEFLGLATFYVGVNAQHERTILMDTIDYNDRLLDLRGYNGTMRFMLDAIVLDSHHAGAEKLLVFSAPWGKPLGFANYVKQRQARSESITYSQSYYFEKTDPEDLALTHSLTGRHHYTEAFGYNAPMIGVIDFGFNLVTLSSVDKLLTGGRGVFEIDVEHFISEFGLEDKAPCWKTQIGGAAEPKPEMLIAARPPDHNVEIRSREDELIAATTARLTNAEFEAPRFELLHRPETGGIQDVLSIEREAFPPELRYTESDIRDRLVLKDAELVCLRDGGDLSAFAVCYVMPAISRDALFLDDLAVRHQRQRKGTGTAILSLLEGLASIRGYSGIYVSAEMSPELSRFYDRAGYHKLAGYPGLGQVLYKPLSLIGPENMSRLATITSHFERRLCKYLSSPRITVHSTLDNDLLQVLNSLEAVFPEDMRYNQTMFRSRMACRDAYIAVFREMDEPVAYCLSFHDPTLPGHALSLDSLSVRPEYQKRGVGRLVIELVFAIPTLTHYTVGVFTCKEKNHDGVDLVEYYQRFGARILERKNDRAVMSIPLDRRWTAFKQDPLQPSTVAGKRASRGPGSSPVPVRTLFTGPSNGAAHPNGAPRASNGRGGPSTAVDLGSVPSNLALSRVPHLGKSEARALAEVGVADLTEFVSRAGSRLSRTSLAEATGIHPEALHVAVHLADIARTGVQVDHLGRLSRFHVRTLEAFRNCELARLRRAIPDRVPDDELLRWKERALQIESAVED
jgi:WD40 repeat protein/GNAT superfamily N-acetyltransferase